MIAVHSTAAKRDADPVSRGGDAIARALERAAIDPEWLSEEIRSFGITDQAALIRIAEVAAAQDGGRTSEYIQNYGITDQAALIRIAEIAMAKSPSGTSRFIQNYGITDQAALIRIAELAAAKMGNCFCEVIQNYGITDQAALIRIAEIVAAQPGWYTSPFIRNYGITDQAALTRIAEIAATQNAGYTSQYIQNYGITDQAALIRIAEIAAAKNGPGTSEYIQNYGITDQAALIRIAEIAATQNAVYTSHYIQNYGITDQAALIRIAVIATAQPDSLISRYIQDYGTTDQAVLLKIVETVLAANEDFICKDIKNFGSTDQAALVKIVNIAMAQNGAGTSYGIEGYGVADGSALVKFFDFAIAKNFGLYASRLIQRYGITDQAALIRIAEIAAAQDGEGTSKYIQDYRITDQAALIRIAEIAAANSGLATSKHVQNYGITDQAALIRIAEIAAAQDGEGTSTYIENYGITDQAALIRIAEIAAAQHGAGTSEHIQNYGVTDQAALIRIAEIAAAQDGGGTSKYIQDYGITDQAALIRIAEIAAAQDADGTSKHIRNYGITDQASLIGIARIAAAKVHSKTAELIQNYGITDQAALIGIAKISAHYSSGATSNHIQNFGIMDQTTLIKIAKIAAAQNGLCISHRIQNYGITDQAALIKIAEIAAKYGKTSEYIHRYAITEQAALIRIAEISAAQDGEHISKYIHRYTITDQAALIRIAEISAAKNGWSTSEYIQNYGITDQAALIKIAEIAAARFGWGTSEYIQNYGITDQVALIKIAKICLYQSFYTLTNREKFNFPPEVFRNEVIQGVFFSPLGSPVSNEQEGGKLYQMLKRAIERLPSEGDLSTIGIDSSDWNTLEPHQRISRIAEWLKSLHPDFDDSLFDYQREVQAENLAVEALVATVCSWKNADVARYGNRGRAALAVLTGYENIPSARLSSNQTRDLWGVLATARDVIGPNLAQAVPVSFASLPKALETITLASTLKALGGEIPKVADCIESNDDFDVFNKELKDRIKEQFQKVLNLDSLDEDKFAGLLSKWGGDITPFTVLAGRFNSQQEWLAEIPVLSEIAKRCLDGSFHDWRYRTDDNQLSMLSEEGLRGWRENPVKLQEHVAGGINPEKAAASLIVNVRQTFETNLLVHLSTEITQEVRSTRVGDAERQRLLSLEERDFAKQVSLPTAIALIQSTLTTEDPEQIRKAVRLVHGNQASLLKNITENKQIKQDLKTLNDHTKVMGGKAGSRYYVFSTITDDPKLLLMTGDLVQCASCQNYRSGSHIQSLPGYVIDGNIKLALSYVIKAEVIDRYHGATFEFDAARQVLKVSGTEEVIALGYALRREVIRLGRVNSEGVVFTERAYLQNHAIAGAIEAQQRELIAEFCRGASVRTQRAEETATFAASRNPSGVYTDARKGIICREYSITAWRVP